MHGADAEIAASGKPLKHKAHTLTGKLLLAITNLAQTDIRFETFQPDILLDNGDRLDQYGLNAQIIHTPGHTNGSIMVMRHLI